jgi:hypothetical protein
MAVRDFANANPAPLFKFPLQLHQGGGIRWVEASYTAIHHVLTNPVYAGAYAYGKTRQETMLDAAGMRRKRLRRLPRSEWASTHPRAPSGLHRLATQA